MRTVPAEKGGPLSAVRDLRTDYVLNPGAESIAGQSNTGYLTDLGSGLSRNPLEDWNALSLLFYELTLFLYATFITSDADKNSGSRGRVKC